MPFLAPVFGAIGAAISGAATFLASGTIAAKVVLAGLAIAAQYAVQAIFRKEPEQPPAQASQLQTRYGENLARSIIFGTVGMAGHHIYRNAYGPGNRTVQDVYVLSHFRISGVSRVRVNGEWRTLDPATGRVQGIDASIFVGTYHGTIDQAADPGLIANSNPPGRWTADHRGAGMAYVVVTSVLDRETLPQPWDAFFEVNGAPLYDWRKDSTAGGDGAHRWANQGTWEFTTNPVLQMYALERGLLNGTERMVGKGVSGAALPLAEWSLAANICDEVVNGTRRYQSSAIVSSGEGVTHDANMRPLLEACAGSWVELVGEEYPLAGANQTPVATFTDDDLVTYEPFRYSARRSRSELVNTVAGSYIASEAFYASVPFATRIDDDALAADRERLAVSIPYGAVTVPACVDRLADIAIRASRYQGSAEICLRPKFLALKPGQWVTWQSARFGWTKQFQVLSKRLGSFGTNSARNVYLSIQEVGAGVFDPTAYQTPPPDSLVQGAPDWLFEVQNFIAAGVTVRDPETEKQYPGIRLSWDLIDDPTVTGVDIKWRPLFQPDLELSMSVPVDQVVVTLVNGLVSDTLFEVTTRPATLPNRPAAPWANWTEVRTPNSPWNDIYLPGMVEEINKFVTEATEWIGPGLRELVDDARRLTAQTVGQDFANYLDKQDLRVELASTTDDMRAEYRHLVTAATGPGSAIVVRLEELQVQVDSEIAEAISLLQTQIDEETGSLANAITALSAGTVGGDISTANFRMTASAGPSGYAARIGMEARAGGAGTYRAASLFLDVPESAAIPTRIVLVADNVVMTNGATNVTPFVFDGSVLRLGGGVRAQWANISQIIADNFQANWAQINNAVINNLTVVDGMIPSGLITTSASNSAAKTGFTGAYETIVTVSINSHTGQPITVFGTVQDIPVILNAGGEGKAYVRLSVDGQGYSVVGGPVYDSMHPDFSGSATYLMSPMGMMIWTPPAPGTYTMRLEVMVSIFGGSGTGTATGLIHATCPRY